MELYTNRYSNHQERHGLAVRTTLGHPRFRLSYPLVTTFRSITPGKDFIRSPRPVFEEKYRAMLDTVTPARIAQELADLAARYETDRIVLLCFDDLRKAGTWCHRTMFGDWWLEKTGEEVLELTPEHPDSVVTQIVNPDQYQLPVGEDQ